MELECEKNHLVQALQVVSRAINTRSPLPILSHVLFQSRGEELSCTATDLDFGVVISVPASGIDSGSVACPARLLGDIVAKLPGAPVRLKAQADGRLHLHCGRSKFEISTLPAEEFPGIPQPGDLPQVGAPQKLLKSAIRRVAFATASSEESRAVMTGVYTHIDGSLLTLVATDGRRMAYQEITIDNPDSLQVQAIVPGRAMQELSRLLGDGDEPVFFSLAQGQFYCRIGNVSMHSRLLEGVFPDYRRVLPQSFQRFGRVGRENMLGAIQRMLVVAQEKQSPNLIVMDLETDLMTLSANTPDVGVATEEVAVVYEGEPLKIAFNGKYVVDALSVLDCEEIELDLQDDTRSGVIRPYAQQDYKYVVMPVRLREVVEEALA
ncbi:DNA polymerase III subunit beta [bacterium]|nr:DNA polymerase III subunit beta [bacterium]